MNHWRQTWRHTDQIAGDFNCSVTYPQMRAPASLIVVSRESQSLRHFVQTPWRRHVSSFCHKQSPPLHTLAQILCDIICSQFQVKRMSFNSSTKTTAVLVNRATTESLWQVSYDHSCGREITIQSEQVTVARRAAHSGPVDSCCVRHTSKFYTVWLSVY